MQALFEEYYYPYLNARRFGAECLSISVSEMISLTQAAFKNSASLFQNIDLSQIPAQLSVIEPITNHKEIRYPEPCIIYLHLMMGSLMLMKQSNHSHRSWLIG